MMKLNLRGDEKIVLDKSCKELKAIRGIHLLDKDGKEILADMTFYNARINDDGSIDADYIIKDGEEKIFDIVVR